MGSLGEASDEQSGTRGQLLQRRRLRAGRLLLKGVAQAEVARRVGVTRTTVSEWNEKLQDGGLQALKRRARGRPAGLDPTQRRELIKHLKEGALAEGFATELWTLRASASSSREVWPPIQREPGVADSGGAGLQQPAAHRTSARARRGGDPALETEALARAKKNARKQGRIIVFIDESGLSEQPTQVRGWAPRGETPVLQYHFNWHQLSVMAGITFYRFYFRLFPGAIKGPQLSSSLTPWGSRSAATARDLGRAARTSQPRWCAITSRASKGRCNWSICPLTLPSSTRPSTSGDI